MNICGCLVHTMPGAADRVAEAAGAVDGVEIHAKTDDGRLVVVVEDTATRFASELIMDLHQIPGVLSLTLNYHHFEGLEEDGDSRPRPVATSRTN